MTTNKRPPVIALCGTSTSTDVEDAIAREAGRLLAEKGALVLCGGLAGVMKSGAQGVTEAGGTCIGFLPGTDAGEGNEYLSFVIPTGMGEMRNGLLARASAGMIAIGGGYGTLSEIGFGARLGKPVACVATFGISQPGTSEPDPGMHWSEDVAEAIDWLWAQIISQP